MIQIRSVFVIGSNPRWGQTFVPNVQYTCILGLHLYKKTNTLRWQLGFLQNFKCYILKIYVKDQTNSASISPIYILLILLYCFPPNVAKSNILPNLATL